MQVLRRDGDDSRGVLPAADGGPAGRPVPNQSEPGRTAVGMVRADALVVGAGAEVSALAWFLVGILFVLFVIEKEPPPHP